LSDELEALKRRFFGRSSEKTEESAQAQLFDEPESPQAQAEELEITSRPIPAVEAVASRFRRT